MQRMYEEYKDIAEFRLVYINEAHAADGTWPLGLAKELGITEHKDYEQRCAVADRLLNDKKLSIPTIVDGMDNAVNEAYNAWPDRVYIVKRDGKLGLAARRGPFGFPGAIKQTATWLAEYKKGGKELELEPAEPTWDFGRRGGSSPRAGRRGGSFKYAGTWNMKTTFEGELIEAVMVLSQKDGKPAGLWKSLGLEMELKDLNLAGNKLSFTRVIPDQGTLYFKGKFDGDQLAGKYTGSFGELDCTGTRKKDE